MRAGRRPPLPLGRPGRRARGAARGEPSEELASNDFPVDVALHRDLAATGFRVLDRLDASSLPDAPADWSRRADAVEAVVARDHGDHPEHREAQRQREVLGRLMAAAEVVTVLLHART